MGTFRSDFLFTNPNFGTGMGSVLNLRGNYFPFSFSSGPSEADIRAMYADFGMVGSDIETVLNENEQQIEEQQAVEK